MPQAVTKFKRYVGHRVREAMVHARRWARPSRGRRVVIFPWTALSGYSGDLRGWARAGELEKLGWRTVCVPPQLELGQRRRVVRLERPDVLLFQQSRHPYNRPRYFPGVPSVFDADDADILDPRCTADVIECCRDSRAVIAGSRFLADLFRPHNPNVRVVWTCSSAGRPGGLVLPSRREPVVTWAQSDPTGLPMEAALVAEVLARLAGDVRFRFRLYGLNDRNRAAAGEYAEGLRQHGIPVELRPTMRYGEFVRSLGDVAVGLQPVCPENPFSRGKSFGKVLAYLAAGAAVVATDALDHPLFFRDGVTGHLVRNDVGEWAERCRRLLTDPDGRGRMAEAAGRDFERRLTTARAAELVGEQLGRAIDLHRRAAGPVSALH